MNWEAITGSAEIVGAIAVVVSLLYLAHEIRSNTKVLKANAGKDAQLQWAVVNEALWQSPDRMVIARALDPTASPEDFSQEEKQMVFWFSRAMLQRFESELFQFQAGLLHEELWNAHRTWCAGFLQLPVIKDWWETERDQPAYTDTFIRTIESTSLEKITPELLGSLANAR
jgi:hypothetical protein